MKNAKCSAAMLLAIAMGMSNNMPVAEEKIPQKRVLTKKEKERIAKQYASEQHEYIIKGVKIVAPNKKIAIKIYNFLNK